MLNEQQLLEINGPFEYASKPIWVDQKNIGHYIGMLKLIDLVITAKKTNCLHQRRR